MNERIRLRRLVLDRSERDQYVLIEKRNGAELLAHLLVDKTTNEYFMLVREGTILLQVFKEIKILPALHERDLAYRRKLMPGVKSNKNPDFRIDGVYRELECPSHPYNYNRIVQRIRKGYNQADKLILYFEKAVNGFTVQKAIQDRFRIRRNFREVIIITGEKIVVRLKNKPGK